MLQILPTNMVMAAIDRPLQLAPKVYDRIGMASPADIFLSAIVNDLVLITEFSHLIICRVFVGMNLGSWLNHGSYVIYGVHGLYNIDNIRRNSGTTIRDPKHSSLTSGTPSTFSGSFPDHIGLVSLAFTKELAGVILHELTDFVSHPPCCLVGDAQLTLQLFGGYSIAAGSHKKHREKPRNKGSCGLVKYSSCSGVKLVSAPRVTIGATLHNWIETIFLPALRASAAIGPAGLDQEFKTGALIGEINLKIR